MRELVISIGTLAGAILSIVGVIELIKYREPIWNHTWNFFRACSQCQKERDWHRAISRELEVTHSRFLSLLAEVENLKSELPIEEQLSIEAKTDQITIKAKNEMDRLNEEGAKMEEGYIKKIAADAGRKGGKLSRKRGKHQPKP